MLPAAKFCNPVVHDDAACHGDVVRLIAFAGQSHVMRRRLRPARSQPRRERARAENGQPASVSENARQGDGRKVGAERGRGTCTIESGRPVSSEPRI